MSRSYGPAAKMIKSVTLSGPGADSRVVSRPLRCAPIPLPNPGRLLGLWWRFRAGQPAARVRSPPVARPRPVLCNGVGSCGRNCSTEPWQEREMNYAMRSGTYVIGPFVVRGHWKYTAEFLLSGCGGYLLAERLSVSSGLGVRDSRWRTRVVTTRARLYRPPVRSRTLRLRRSSLTAPRASADARLVEAARAPFLSLQSLAGLFDLR